MRWKARFSLRTLLLLVTFAAIATLVALNGQGWYSDFLDWQATRSIRQRAQKIFRDEIGNNPPAELIHILGSGDLSHWDQVDDIGLTSDQVISCGSDQAVRCWSTESGESLEVISGVTGHIAAKSSLLVTIDPHQQARVYDTSSSPLKFLRQFSIADTSPIQTSFTSGLTSDLAIIYNDRPNDVQLWDLDSGQRKCTLCFSEEATEVCLGFREKEDRVLAACNDKFLLIDSNSGEVVSQWKHDPWPLANQARRHTIPLGHPWWLVVGAGTNIAWNEESHEWKEVELESRGTPDLVIPGRYGGGWVVNRGIMAEFSLTQDGLSLSHARTTPIMQVTCMALRRDLFDGTSATYRAVGTQSGQIALLDGYGQVRLPQYGADHISSVAWSNSGDMVAVGTSAGELIVLQAGKWTELQRFRAHGGAVDHMEFSPDGTTLLSEEKYEIAVFNWKSGKSFVRKSRQAALRSTATLSSGDGRLLTFVLNEGWRLIDYASNTLIAKSERRAPSPQSFSTQGVTWSPTEQCFVFITKEELCRLKLVGERSALGPTLEITKGPPSKKVYLRDLSTRDSRALFIEYPKGRKRLRIWNWQTSEEKRIDLGPREVAPFAPAAFASSGGEIAVVVDGDLILFSATGEESYRHRIGPTHMRAVAIEFSPDNRYMAVVNGNGTCYLFRNPCR